MLFAFAFTGYVQRSSVAVAAERMMPELGLSQVQIGWLFTAFLVTYAVFQIPGALIGQVLGARRILAIIAIIGVLGSLLTATAPWFAAAGLGRTNLRPYVNLNFDPNDSIRDFPSMAVCWFIA